MKITEQLQRLYEIEEKLRILQDNGLWEKLQTSKEIVIKVIVELENLKEIK